MDVKSYEVREGLSEEVTFDQEPERGEREHHVGIRSCSGWGRVRTRALLSTLVSFSCALQSMILIKYLLSAGPYGEQSTRPGHCSCSLENLSEETR